VRTNREHPLRPMSTFLLLLLLISLVTAGCGKYSSQAEKYLTQARSQVLRAAYTLERFGDGEVSGTFARTSLQQYAKAMQKTGQTLKSLKPPPAARTRHERAVEALSRAQRLVQEKGKQGIEPNEAQELAGRLKELVKELRKP
jgi:hypothetical protein